MTNIIQAGEKRIYAFQHQAVLKRPCHIIEIPPGTGELGFTQSNGDIHLAGDHPLMNSLSESKQAFFRCGVFVHEMLHQCYTDFAYFEEMLARQTDDQEKQVFSLFVNLVEDPAIEYFAPLIFGGYMMEALRFSIRHIYQNAPDLSESKDAFGQLVNALIMFGDMGLLKGSFTYPQAQEMFLKLIPSFNAAVTNPSSKARIDAAETWMILTKPLWKKSENISEMMEGLKQSGMTSSMGEQPQKPQPPEEPQEKPEESEAATRRKELEKAVTGTEEQGADGSGGDSSGERDEKSEPGTECKGTESETLDEILKRFQCTEDGTEECEDTGDAESEFWADVEQESAKADQNETRDTMDLPVVIPKANGGVPMTLRVLNRKPELETGDERSYARLLSRVSRDIRMLTSALKNIFRADYEEYIHSTAGSYQLKRDLDHTSVKVFDRKKERKNTDDLAVTILVDISGSMRGNKIALARSCTVTLAETFAALKIPCYIMGFTADTAGAQAVHEHYVTWANSPKERISLVKIQAQANNDDGYSIRYATQLLKKKPAEHKLLFVISDGAPACRRYQRTDGIKDTSAAILEARKAGVTIFGVGIGVCAYQELKGMYRGDYINVRDVSELTGALAKQLKRTIKRF